MKDLTPEEVETAPPKVLFLWMMAIREQPVGTEMYEEALKDYPEYFPDELLHRKKWAAIPQSVHDEYYKEKERSTAKVSLRQKRRRYTIPNNIHHLAIQWSRSPYFYQHSKKIAGRR